MAAWLNASKRSRERCRNEQVCQGWIVKALSGPTALCKNIPLSPLPSEQWFWHVLYPLYLPMWWLFGRYIISRYQYHVVCRQIPARSWSYQGSRSTEGTHPPRTLRTDRYVSPPPWGATRFNKIASQGTPQMAADKKAISLSRVLSSPCYSNNCNLPLF